MSLNSKETIFEKKQPKVCLKFFLIIFIFSFYFLIASSAFAITQDSNCATGDANCTVVVSPIHSGWDSFTEKVSDIFKFIFDIKDKVVTPIITTPTPQVVNTPTTIIQQITQAGLTGNTGQQGLRGFTGLQGLKGDKGDKGNSGTSIDTSSFVTKIFFDRQVDAIYNSSNKNLQSLATSKQDALNGTGFVKISGTTISYDNSTYLTSLSGAVLTNQSTPQTIGLTGSRLSKLWTTDLDVTNTITGSISGNAGTVTNGAYINTANTFTNPAPMTTLAESWIGPSSTTGIYFKGGNVGVGTTSPLSKLSINGGLHIGGDSDAGDNNLLVDGTITAPQINKSIVVDGVKYPATGAGIQAAIDDLPATGGEVIIPAGTYIISATINISKPAVYLVGQGTGWQGSLSTPLGTILKLANGANYDMFNFNSTSPTHAFFGGIKNLGLDGNKANQTAPSNGIVVSGDHSDLSFTNVVVSYFNGTGIKLSSAHVLWNVWITNSFFEYNTDAAISAIATTQNVNWLHIDGNHIVSSDSTNAIYFEGGTKAVSESFITNNLIYATKQHSIFIKSSNNITISNNIITNGGTDLANTYDGIYITDDGAHASKNIVISNNRIGAMPGPWGGAVIYPRYGISLNSLTDYVTITGNDLGNNSADINIPVGVNTHGIVANYDFTNSNYLIDKNTKISGNILINGTGNSYIMGNVGIGLTTPTAILHIKAGSDIANGAPLKLTSGALTTGANITAGSIEFLTDAYYGTISTGLARKTFAFLESPTFTTPSLGSATATGLSITSANTTQVTTASALALNVNSLTTGTGFYTASSSLSSGSLFDLAITGTAGLTNQKGINVSLSGANTTPAQTTYGAYLSNTHTGTSNNVGLYATATGGTNNYAAIFEAGNVGIGTTVPTGKLNIATAASDNIIYADDYSTTAGNANYWFSRRSHSNTLETLTTTLTGDFIGAFFFQGVNTSNAFAYGAKIIAQQNGTAGTYIPTDLNFSTYSATAQNTNQLVLNNSGNVGIGTTDPGAKLEIYNTTNPVLRLSGTGNDLDDNPYGAIEFYNRDNTGDGPNVGAKIEVRSTNSDNNYGRGGVLAFYTTVGNSGEGLGPVERLRIDKLGNVGIGTINPTNILSLGNAADRKFWIENTATNFVGRALTIAAGGTVEGTATPNLTGGNLILQSGLGTGTGASTISFQTGTTLTTGLTLQTMSTKMTILGNGNVGIRTTTPAYNLQVSSDIADYAGAIINDGNLATRSGLLIQSGLDDNSVAGPSTLIGFKDGDATSIGSITFGSNAVAYNTTSDERLKTLVNEKTLSSLNILNQIAIHDFTWNNDTSNDLYSGVFAQELYTIYPHAVTKPIKEEDNWMVDYSKLTPVIIASIQEMNLKIEDISNLATENTWRDSLIAWLGNVTNGIAKIFVGEINARNANINDANINNLCVTDDSGEKVCITKQELLQIKTSAGIGATNSGSGSNGNTDNAETTDVCPNIDGVQTEIPAGDEINTEGQCVEITGGDTGGADESKKTSDTTAPVITLSGDNSITLKVGDTYTEAGATAKDDVDTSVTVDISGTVDTATAGTYTIKYNAKDEADNSAIEVTRTVIVE